MSSHDEVMTQYRVLVDTISANERRRQQVNVVYITLFAAIFGTIGTIDEYDFLILAIIGALLSIVWFMQITYFRRLADAKFYVIAELESKMEYKPFEVEWKQLNNRFLFVKLTDIERILPVIAFIVSMITIFFEI